MSVVALEIAPINNKYHLRPTNAFYVWRIQLIIWPSSSCICLIGCAIHKLYGHLLITKLLFAFGFVYLCRTNFMFILLIVKAVCWRIHHYYLCANTKFITNNRLDPQSLTQNFKIYTQCIISRWNFNVSFNGNTNCSRNQLLHLTLKYRLLTN